VNARAGSAALFGRVLASVILLGIAWFAAELGLTLASRRALGLEALTRDAWRLLPFQILLFAALGVPIAALAVWRRLGTGTIVWMAVAPASFLFLAARFVEGLMRYRGPTVAALGVLGVAIGLLALLWPIAIVARRLPPAWRAAWPWAAALAWSIFFVASMHRAGPAIGLQESGVLGWTSLLRAADAVLAVAVGAVALGVGASHRRSLGLAAAGLLLVGVVLAAAFRPAASPATHAGAPARGDVIVLLVDTWRFDHLGVNAGRPDLTPALDALAAESIRFTRGYSPGNYTKLAMPGVLASTSPAATGDRLGEKVVTLAERLREAGYSTAGVSSNPLVSSEFGYGQGFDRFLDPSDTDQLLVGHLLQMSGHLAGRFTYQHGIRRAFLYHRTADDLRRASLRMFDRLPAPVFLYVHTMDMHGPYLPPRRLLPPDFDYAKWMSYYTFNALSRKGVFESGRANRQLDNVRARYRTGAVFTDQELGALIDELRARGRWEEATVWLLSDHGEAFGEHDYAGHGGRNMTSTLLHVPFLLKPPRSAGLAPRVVADTVSTYDVVPTTLSLLGLPPAEDAFGVDLLPALRAGAPDGERVAVSYGRERSTRFYTATRGPWKLDVVVKAGGARQRSLFDLARDPGELRDVGAEHPDVVASLERALEAWWEREQRARVDAVEEDLDALTREQLRRLGYAE
jgi:arylsulfatase